MKTLLTRLHKALLVWDHFWWPEIDSRSLKWARITLGFSAVCLYALRFWRMDFYDERAMIPREHALDLLDSYQRPWFSWNLWPDSWALGVQIIFWLLLVLLTLGFTRRPLMILSWVIHVGFLNRNFAASMGVDTMVTVFLFYMSFCEVWKSHSYDLLTKLMVRMAQVHLAIIYFYTGLEKLRGATWWEGSSLWIVFNNPQMTQFSLSWTAAIPSVLAILAHTTILFEVFFGALVFNSKSRLWILAVGVSFHLGIAVILDLWAFSAVMVSQYFLYLQSEDWNKLQILAKPFRNLKMRTERPTT